MYEFTRLEEIDEQEYQADLERLNHEIDEELGLQGWQGPKYYTELNAPESLRSWQNTITVEYDDWRTAPMPSISQSEAYTYFANTLIGSPTTIPGLGITYQEIKRTPIPNTLLSWKF